jgi:hypothetical protein
LIPLKGARVAGGHCWRTWKSRMCCECWPVGDLRRFGSSIDLRKKQRKAVEFRETKKSGVSGHRLRTARYTQRGILDYAGRARVCDLDQRYSCHCKTCGQAGGGCARSSSCEWHLAMANGDSTRGWLTRIFFQRSVAHSTPVWSASAKRYIQYFMLGPFEEALYVAFRAGPCVGSTTCSTSCRDVSMQYYIWCFVLGFF